MIEIIPMTEEHLDGVTALEEATFSIPWPRSEFEREIKENNMAIYYVGVEDGKVIGYAGMWHVVVEGHITNVGVLEEARRKGVGSMLMENSSKSVWKRKCMASRWRYVWAMPLRRRCIISMALRRKASARTIILIQRKMPSSCGNILRKNDRPFLIEK